MCGTATFTPKKGNTTSWLSGHDGNLRTLNFPAPSARRTNLLSSGPQGWRNESENHIWTSGVTKYVRTQLHIGRISSRPAETIPMQNGSRSIGTHRRQSRPGPTQSIYESTRCSTQFVGSRLELMHDNPEMRADDVRMFLPLRPSRWNKCCTHGDQKWLKVSAT